MDEANGMIGFSVDDKNEIHKHICNKNNDENSKFHIQFSNLNDERKNEEIAIIRNKNFNLLKQKI